MWLCQIEWKNPSAWTVLYKLSVMQKSKEKWDNDRCDRLLSADERINLFSSWCRFSTAHSVNAHNKEKDDFFFVFIFLFSCCVSLSRLLISMWYWCDKIIIVVESLIWWAPETAKLISTHCDTQCDWRTTERGDEDEMETLRHCDVWERERVSEWELVACRMPFVRCRNSTYWPWYKCLSH